MPFSSSDYGKAVEDILALDGHGARRMPLAAGKPFQPGITALAGKKAEDLFKGARSPEAALSGLYLYFCGYDQSHSLSQEIQTAEGSFWHAIMHRQEADPSNSAYWFRRVGQHPTFPQLQQAAEETLQQRPTSSFFLKSTWDPFTFIDFCEKARRDPGSPDEEIAMQIQLAEWQLLFDYCAKRVRP